MLFDYDPFVTIMIESPNSTVEEVKCEFDYSQEAQKLFEKNYKNKKIIVNDEFKRNYEELFQVKKYKDPERIKVSFDFVKFVKTFITYKKYERMVIKGTNFYPFPLVVKFTIKKNGQLFQCNAYAEKLYNDMVKLVIYKNENFVIIYRSEYECKFKFKEDLNEEEKDLIDRFNRGIINIFC